ncbi:hypothetical protein HY065_02280 [Candidatus Berkelbacteria bacterium]|nr:hypothetical protein [Candidatus Berkelbacteria bacterium]
MRKRYQAKNIKYRYIELLKIYVRYYVTGLQFLRYRFILARHERRLTTTKKKIDDLWDRVRFMPFDERRRITKELYQIEQESNIMEQDIRKLRDLIIRFSTEYKKILTKYLFSNS